MAFHLPESEFVGIDLSGRQADAGRAVVGELGLENIRIEHADILDVDDSWGRFDYIIAHGVYSWVPDPVQRRLLSLCARNLSEQGIAYISYNTYPGWHVREMIRHMMLFHGNRFEETDERIEQARALIDFLSGAVPTADSAYGMLLKQELDLVRRCTDAYLFHDHMEEVNAPLYFHQFVERAARHGLQYLGEAEFSTMLPNAFPATVRETLDRISPNIIYTEQYMDFLRNRQFRQTLLCHKDLPLDRNLTADALNGMLIASSAQCAAGDVDLSPDLGQSFRTPGGAVIQAERPLTKACLAVLGEIWPGSSDIDALYRLARQRTAEAGIDDEACEKTAQRVLREDVLQCYAADIVELRSWEGDFAASVNDRPRVSKLAVFQAEHGLPVVNQRHEPVRLDSVAKHLVPVLDGTRNRASLLRHLNALVAEGALVARREGEDVANADELRDALAEALENCLSRLAATSMLTE